MRLADKDLNVFMPRMRRTKLLKEVNHALETVIFGLMVIRHVKELI